MDTGIQQANTQTQKNNNALILWGTIVSLIGVCFLPIGADMRFAAFLIGVCVIWACISRSVSNRESSESIFLRGRKYEKGDGVDQDYDKAIDLYKLAAKKKSANAYYSLGMMYKEGRGVQTDYAQAENLLFRSAKLENADAQYHLFMMHRDGLAVNINGDQAMRWIFRAVDLGHVQAEELVSFEAEHGNWHAREKMLSRIKKGERSAVQWLVRCAERGSWWAQTTLGHMYREGKGVPRDYTKAKRWYTRAAEDGDWDAQHDLGCMYANGTGVLKDYVKAYMWFNISSVNGNENAKKHLDVLEGKMSPEQIGIGQSFSYKWMEKHNKTNEN